MAGVVSTLTHRVPSGDATSGTGQARTLGSLHGTAVSRSGRRGDASGTGLYLTLGVAVGRENARGAGAAQSLSTLHGSAGGYKGARSTCEARTLPLTPGAGTGQRGTALVGTGSTYPLPFLRASGQGGKAARGLAGSQACPLTLGPSSGYAAKRAGVAMWQLPLAAAAGPGTKATAGRAARPVELGLTWRPVEGYAREWRFTPPTGAVHAQLRPHSRLYGATAVGLTTWRSADGQWHTAYSPNPQRLVGADPIYRGGYVHPLSDTARAELIDAGLGAHVTLQEI